MKKYIDLIKRYSGDLDRDLKNVFLAIRVYSITLALIFVVFGVFGIKPLVDVILSKIRVVQELRKNNEVLASNLVQYQLIRNQLQENSTYIIYLDHYLPLSPNTQSYLLDFVDAAGSAGYTIKNFSQADYISDKNTTELNIFMEGNRYPNELIQKTEDLKRITKVKRVIFFAESRLGVPNYTVNMTVQIYNYDGN